MTTYLLAAEADQIQDLLFRSSKLRAIVGGSQLLSKFCNKVPEELLKPYGDTNDIIVQDGGAFRIVFHDDDEGKKARQFGRDLADSYCRILGGNLTVAEPILYEQQKFQAASQKAQDELRIAKNKGDAPAMPLHMPYLAFCASCGVGIAAARYKRHKKDERENYYCASCQLREEERDAAKVDRHGFLGLFQSAVEEVVKQANPSLAVPLDLPEEAEDVADFDLTGRRYVAYLLADSNGMGSRFSACSDENTMKKLSQALPCLFRSSLAAPCLELLQRLQETKTKKQLLPVLPLILGGDDLFALLPAPWALDFAARFCQAYEQNMQAKLKELELAEQPTPTIAVAVVICKANYPHTLAHREGERLLKQAKQMARGLEVKKQQYVSVLNFSKVLGNAVGESDQKLEDYRPTARSYFVSNNLSADCQEAGLAIQTLLAQRYQSQSLPAKRRAQFARLYYDMTCIRGTDKDIEQQKWDANFQALLDRIKHRDQTLYEDVTGVMKALGDEDQTTGGYWRFFERPEGDSFHGHGFADLLALWDYAYDLSKELTTYEE